MYVHVHLDMCACTVYNIFLKFFLSCQQQDPATDFHVYVYMYVHVYVYMCVCTVCNILFIFLGFQQQDPATDFRGAGMLPLKELMVLAKSDTQHYCAMLARSKGIYIHVLHIYVMYCYTYAHVYMYIYM